MIHGVGSSGMVWNPHFEELAKMFETIYCVDLPGFGRVCTPENLLNQKTSLAYDALFVEFLSLYIDTVIPADSVCYLYGHSFGAHLALSYAAQYPKRISGLILAHPAGILPTLGKSGAYWGILFKLSPVQRILRSIGCLGLRFIAFWLHLLHQPFEAIYWLYVMFVIMHSHNTLSATRSLEGRTASEIWSSVNMLTSTGILAVHRNYILTYLFSLILLRVRVEHSIFENVARAQVRTSTYLRREWCDYAASPGIHLCLWFGLSVIVR